MKFSVRPQGKTAQAVLVFVHLVVSFETYILYAENEHLQFELWPLKGTLLATRNTVIKTFNSRIGPQLSKVCTWQGELGKWNFLGSKLVRFMKGTCLLCV